MSCGASLPHKATIDSGSEQPGRYYSPNPAPIIQARERARDTEREVELKMRSSQTVHTQGHCLTIGTDKERDGAGYGGCRASCRASCREKACRRLTVGDAQIGEEKRNEVKTCVEAAQKHATA